MELTQEISSALEQRAVARALEAARQEEELADQLAARIARVAVANAVVATSVEEAEEAVRRSRPEDRP